MNDNEKSENKATAPVTTEKNRPGRKAGLFRTAFRSRIGEVEAYRLTHNMAWEWLARHMGSTDAALSGKPATTWRLEYMLAKKDGLVPAATDPEVVLKSKTIDDWFSMTAANVSAVSTTYGTETAAE
jgi:hypothetical protein